MPDSELLAAARTIASEIVADRRQIHQHPELAYEEEQTSALVASRLRDLGLDVTAGVAGTGVIGVLEGKLPGKTVLLRADMDALPIVEQNEASYCSLRKGVMHACGHDGHTAMLLGAAKLLTERREQLPGRVKFMFQPAEEGGFGALRMIEAGLLDSPAVDAAFALHIDGFRYVGQIGLRVGPASAASDRFTVTIQGKGGHAARPNMTVDPIVLAAQVILSLQTLVSREISPTEQAVVTIGAMESGTASNVISDAAVLRGTARTYSEEVRAHIERRISEIAGGIARAMRGDAETEYVRGYPSIVNTQDGVDVVSRVVTDMLGEQSLVEAEMMMGGEDFSYLLERVPGAFLRLGVRNRAWKTPRLAHSAGFDLDEEALPIGTAVLAATALRYLRQE
jgi:amidohydrolase